MAEVQGELLRQAELELRTVREEMYGYRRAAWEAQQNCSRAVAAQEAVAAELAELREQHAVAQEAARQLPPLQAEHKELQAEHDELRHQSQQMGEARRILQVELQQQRSSCEAAEAALSGAQAEVSRLQRLQDDSTAKLRAMEKRLADAEQDAERAEDEAHALRRELTERAASLAADANTDAAAPAAHQQQQEEQARQEQELQSLQEALAAAQAQLATVGQHRDSLLRTLQSMKAAGVAGPLPRHDGAAAAAAVGAATAAADAAVQCSMEPPAAQTAPAAAADGGIEGAAREAAEELRISVSRLKRSRDKLLAQLDRMAQDNDRTLAENAMLAAGLKQACVFSNQWEAQTQGALQQLEHLKDLLEEAGSWSLPAAALEPAARPPPPQAPPRASTEAAGEQAAAAVSAEPAAGSGQEECLRLQQELQRERARSAQLDLQVRALCSELTRASQVAGQVGKATLPALHTVEARLSQLLSDS